MKEFYVGGHSGAGILSFIMAGGCLIFPPIALASKDMDMLILPLELCFALPVSIIFIVIGATQLLFEHRFNMCMNQGHFAKGKIVSIYERSIGRKYNSEVEHHMIVEYVGDDGNTYRSNNLVESSTAHGYLIGNEIDVIVYDKYAAVR